MGRVIVAVVVVLLCLGWAGYDFQSDKEAAVRICGRQEPAAQDDPYRLQTTAGDFKFRDTAPTDDRAARMYATMPVGATVILKYRGNKLTGNFVVDVAPAAGKTPEC